MDYSELVQSIATAVLEEMGISEKEFRVGHDTYQLDSVNPKKEEEFIKRLEAQNIEKNNMTPEQKANQLAGEAKSQKNRVEKNKADAA
jgi:hypothetical protein